MKTIKFTLLTAVLAFLTVQLLAQPYTLQLSDESGFPGQTVSFPVVASGFPNDVGAVNIFIQYDTNVLSYESATPGLIYAFINNQDTVIGAQWSTYPGQAVNGTLFTMIFTVKSGNCSLTIIDILPLYNTEITNQYTLPYEPLELQHATFTTNTSCEWTGDYDTDWHNPLNWNCSVIPDENLDVTIPNVANDPRVKGQNAKCKSLNVETGATVTVDLGWELKVYE